MHVSRPHHGWAGSPHLLTAVHLGNLHFPSRLYYFRRKQFQSKSVITQLIFGTLTAHRLFKRREFLAIFVQSFSLFTTTKVKKQYYPWCMMGNKRSRPGTHFASLLARGKRSGGIYLELVALRSDTPRTNKWKKKKGYIKDMILCLPNDASCVLVFGGNYVIDMRARCGICQCWQNQGKPSDAILMWNGHYFYVYQP